MYRIEFTGIREYSDMYTTAVLKRVEKRVLGKVAAYAKKDTKENIKVSLKRRTGRLLKNIKYKSLRGNAYRLFAGRSGYNDGKDKNPYYAIMQEAGTRERFAKNGGYLTFEIGGRWVKKKSVKALKPVWFMRRAFESINNNKHKSEIDKFMQKCFDEIERKQRGL